MQIMLRNNKPYIMDFVSVGQQYKQGDTTVNARVWNFSFELAELCSVGTTATAANHHQYPESPGMAWDEYAGG